MRNAGYIKIDRQNRTVAIRDVERAAHRIKNGANIMTFPEGACTRDGKAREFKQGMFHLALQAEVPIVPISISGAFEILNRMALKTGKGKVIVIIDEPIDTIDISYTDRDKLSVTVRSTIISNCEKGNLLACQKNNQ